MERVESSEVESGVILGVEAFSQTGLNFEDLQCKASSSCLGGDG